MEYLVAIAAMAVLVAVRELTRFGVFRATKQLGLSLIAGLAATYLGVAGLAFAFHATHGRITGYRTGVDAVLDGYDAAGKLAPGDIIVAVEGASLDSPDDLSGLVAAHDGAPVKLTIERAGATSEVTVAPKPNPERGGPRFLLGVRKQAVPVTVRDLGAAVSAAATFPVDGVRALAAELVPRDAADPGGPVRIVEEYAAQRSFADRAWRAVLRIAIGVMLALVALDIVRFLRTARAARSAAR